MLPNDRLNLIFKNNIHSLKMLKYDLQDPSTYSMAVFSSFLLFIVIQTTLLPLYLLIYLYMLMFYSTNTYNYVYDPNQLEVVPIEHFYRFSNMYLEFVYNITYRRACINTLTTLYSMLKFWNTNNLYKLNSLEKIFLFVKLITSLCFRLLGTSWFVEVDHFNILRLSGVYLNIEGFTLRCLYEAI